MSFTSARRDVWLVVGAKSVSWLGDEAAMVAMMLRLQSEGAGAGAVAALLIANMVPIVALSGVVGRLLDRHDNRRLLTLSSLAQAMVCAGLAFTSPAWAVLALVCLLGVGQAVNGSTWSALLPAITGREDLPAAIGRVQAGMTLAGVAAPALGGLLTGWYGARVPLLLDAVTFLVVTVAARLLVVRRGGPRSAATALGSAPVPAAPVPAAPAVRLESGLHIVRTDALLRPLFVLLAVFVLLASMVNVADVFLIRQTLHASTLWYGLAGAGFSVGALLGALGGGRVRGGGPLVRAFVASTVVASVALMAMGCVPSVFWLLPAGFVLGAANAVLNVSLSSLVMGRAADDERGRVGALLSGVASGTQLLAFVAGGALVGVLSPRTVFVLAGALGLVGPAVFGRPLLRAAPADAEDTVPLPHVPADATPAAAA